jgi:hypothetical protein
MTGCARWLRRGWVELQPQLTSVTSPDSTLSIRIHSLSYSQSHKLSAPSISFWRVCWKSAVRCFRRNLRCGFISYLLLLAFVTASLPRRSPPSTQDWLSQPGQRHPIAKYHYSYRTTDYQCFILEKMAHHVIVGVLKKAPARARPTGRLSKKG